MDIEIVFCGRAGGDGIRRLRTWLANDPELRDRIHLVEREPGAAELGAIQDVLLAALAPGGAAAACAAGLISWMRARTSDVAVRVRRADGTEIEVSAGSVRQVNVADVSAVVRELCGWLEGGQAPPDIEALAPLSVGGDAPTLPGEGVDGHDGA